MLERLVRRLIDKEEAQCASNRHIFTEVGSVLNEMVYDVECCEHECELVRLRRQLAAAENSLAEYQERESEMIQDMLEASNYTVKMEQDGRAIMSKLNEYVSVLVTELAKKEFMDKQLQQANEQLKLTGQLLRELASAQREIRELRRANYMQTILRRNSFVPTKLVYNSRMGSAGDHESMDSMSASDEPPSLLKARSNCFSALSDSTLLRLFSFLDEESMVAMSVIDKVLVTRVNVLFGVITPTDMPNRSFPAQIKQRPASPHGRKWSKPRSFPLIGSVEKDKLSKVDAIVKALKPDQIKLFHDMSTRVKRLEAHLTQMQTDKEDVAARLHSAENVRDFLMEKLKDLEDTLANSMTMTAKKDEQACVDREIIGFLDAKTQEYEVALKEYAQQNNSLRVELAHVHEEHASKTTIIQDMVELLAEEKKELESQVRAQRKILVREVKGLRAQNQQIVAEKEKYFKQLKHLKHALRHLDELT